MKESEKLFELYKLSIDLYTSAADESMTALHRWMGLAEKGVDHEGINEAWIDYLAASKSKDQLMNMTDKIWDMITEADEKEKREVC